MTTEGRKEEILYKAHPPMFRNHPVWFTISVLLIAAFGLGIVILVIWWIASISHSLTITARELRYEVGILSKSRSEL